MFVSISTTVLQISRNKKDTASNFLSKSIQIKDNNVSLTFYETDINKSIFVFLAGKIIARIKVFGSIVCEKKSFHALHLRRGNRMLLCQIIRLARALYEIRYSENLHYISLFWSQHHHGVPFTFDIFLMDRSSIIL